MSHIARIRGENLPSPERLNWKPKNPLKKETPDLLPGESTMLFIVKQDRKPHDRHIGLGMAEEFRSRNSPILSEPEVKKWGENEKQ